ncbi:hypothetical protein CDL12_07322 [Handroanthus impetiginosus]|uniref:C2 domain-containing protein n=1 Tax=Handroanthus impetiginosus TaxID=429701 RepID=A0A2G9HR46_9LAMI|nr:hypothetical protein CDL12_07322 [Handroanthus impetiginosus]
MEVNASLHGWKFTGEKFKNTHDLVKQIQWLYIRVVKTISLPQNNVTGNCDPCVVANYNHTTHHVEKNSNAKWNQVIVQDKGVVNDDFIRQVVFDLSEIPNMVAQDGPPAPQWCGLEDKKNRKTKGELLLAVWMGAETDAHDDQGWHPEVFVKDALGNQALRTRVSMSRSINPMWNEELMFVAAEPFEVQLGSNNDEVLGRCLIPLQYVDRRFDHKPVNMRWYHLEKYVVDESEEKEVKFASVINMRICLEGRYHVYDEPTHRSSDKDNHSFDPMWNEQYTWEVFNPCAIVTIGVFDNCGLQDGDKSERDSRVGRVRIRLSTLERTLHNLMYRGTQIISMRLSRAEPPLRKKVVNYILDVAYNRSKANALRIIGLLNGLTAFRKWFDEIRNWKSPVTTVIIHILL